MARKFACRNACDTCAIPGVPHDNSFQVSDINYWHCHSGYSHRAFAQKQAKQPFTPQKGKFCKMPGTIAMELDDFWRNYYRRPCCHYLCRRRRFGQHRAFVSLPKTNDPQQASRYGHCARNSSGAGCGNGLFNGGLCQSDFIMFVITGIYTRGFLRQSGGNIPVSQ